MATATSLHIALPQKMRGHIERQVERESYSTKSDYVQHLIREDMKNAERAKLEQMLLSGLASGRKEYTKKEWADLGKRLVASEIAQSQSKNSHSKV